MLQKGRDALVVDPGDARPVLEVLQRDGLQLQAILVTHHHGDHVGGIADLVNATGAAVWGPAKEAMPTPCTPLREGDTVHALGLTLNVLDVPGHTAGHIAFYCADLAPAPVLFCGDTLFSAGCGRLFEGTPAQMLNSLTRLAALPGSTRVCCTHEYTLSNVKFAMEVEPDNTALQHYQAECQALRAQGLPTLPSHIAREQAINPFLRSHLPTVMASAQRFDASMYHRLGAFATLREWKNQYV